MLLDYHGITKVSEAELRGILKTRPAGTNVLNLLFLKNEKRWNLEVEIVRASPRDFRGCAFAPRSDYRVR